jgi:phosphomannomutase
MQINPKIFKAYDIRGVYPDELTEDVAYRVGQAFAKYSKANPIMVGRDTRVSSPELSEAFISGIVNQGIDVIDIGLCSTSCFYFTLAESGLDGGIMITASHNSKEFNGFKPALKDSAPLTKEQLLELKKIILETDLQPTAKKGSVINQDSTDNYILAVRNSIKEKIKPLKVVMDAGNGMAGLYIEKVFSNIGLDVIPIFIELDGNFPNHETNPKIQENRVKLAEKIITEKADLGFMFDGDADRVGILDRNGEVIDYSLVLAIISEYLIKKSSRKKVVVEVRTSHIVNDWVKKAGGELIISSSWTIPIKLEMKSDPEIAFGGETSGHYMFPEIHDTDDGIFGALTFLQAISTKEETIDEIIEEFRKTHFVLEETNFKITDGNKAQNLLKNVREKYSAEGAQILDIDGVSVIFPDWWFNIRESQSEPLLRLNLEANSKELFEEKKAEVIALLEN